MLRTLALALALTALAPVGSAQFFVATTGSDTTGNGSSGNPWRTLTFAAAPAQSGSSATINVAAGTYGVGGAAFLEGIEVSSGRTLTIVGAGRDTTIVKANLGFTRTIRAPGFRTYHGVFLIHGVGTKVDISGLTADADNLAVTTTDRLACMVYSDGASGTVSTCSLINAGSVVPNGSQTHYAFLGAGKSTVTSTVNVVDCLVTKWNKGGIVMAGVGLTGSIVSCTITGSGTLSDGQAAQNAIQISHGSKDFSVRYNVIQDVWYTPVSFPDFNAVGVLVYETVGAHSIDCNTFVGCKTAFFQQAPSGTSDFVNNHVRNCQWGADIRTDGVSMGDASIPTSGNNRFDAGISVFVSPAASGTTINKNSYSDLRNNAGFPSYRADGNSSVIDSNVDPFCMGFNTPVNIGGITPGSIVTGDFNGDSKPDYAVVITGGVAIHLGNGGTSFASPTFVSAIGVPLFLTTGQFTTGTSLDLAVVSSDGTARILVNNGAGVFTPGLPRDVNGTALNTPTSIAMGNFNGAAEDDIVVGFAGPGDAFWCPVVNGVIGTETSLDGVAADKLSMVNGAAGADITGNAREDIVLMDRGATRSRLRVYEQTGAGVFATPKTFLFATGGHGVCVGDIDTPADGKIDVVFTRAGAPGWVHVMKNVGGATLLTEAGGSPFRVDDNATECAMIQSKAGAKLDVAVVHPARSKVTILRGFDTASGEFADFRGCSVGKNPAAIAFAFLDAPFATDDIDMFVAATDDNRVEVYAAADLTAVFDTYGFGCTGGASSGNKIPVYVSTPPSLGDKTWSIGVKDGRPNRVSVGCLSVLKASPLPTTCGTGSLVTDGFHIDLGIATFFCTIRMTDNTGKTAPFTLGVPNCPEFAGLEFYSQWGVDDDEINGPYNFQIALTPGVRFRIGNNN